MSGATLFALVKNVILVLFVYFISLKNVGPSHEMSLAIWILKYSKPISKLVLSELHLGHQLMLFGLHYVRTF